MTAEVNGGPGSDEGVPTGAGWDEQPGEPLHPPCLHWVVLYLIKLGWGGPEEGSWYYDAGELVTDPDLYARLGGYPAAFPTEDEAYAYCARLNLGIASLNEDRRPKSSVASEGEYEVLVLEVPMLHRHWPGTPPRYEWRRRGIPLLPQPIQISTLQRAAR